MKKKSYVERFKLTICGLKGCWYQGEGFSSRKAFEKAVKALSRELTNDLKEILNPDSVSLAS